MVGEILNQGGWSIFYFFIFFISLFFSEVYMAFVHPTVGLLETVSLILGTPYTTRTI